MKTRNSIVCVLLSVSASLGGSLWAQEQTTSTSASADSKPTIPPLPDLTIPKDANREALEALIDKAKKATSHNLDQYRTLQTAIRDASNQLFSVINNRGDARSIQAELDSLAASAALMVNESEEARASVLERMTKYLKSRDELSLTDVNTGLLVGLHLEMQPQKRPSRDLYALMADLLEKDDRDEMKSVRVTLQANIRRLELLGNKIKLDDEAIDGRVVKTERYAGKFILVTFFAGWSPPCVNELKRIQSYYEKYSSKGLEVVGISLDAEKKTVESFVAEQKIKWPVIHDSSRKVEDMLSMRYGILSLPSTFLVNKEGTVVSLEAYGPELDRLMQMLFEEPTPAAAEPKSPAGEKKVSTDR